MEALIYPAVVLVAVLYAIRRGHAISFGFHLEPKNRRE